MSWPTTPPRTTYLGFPPWNSHRGMPTMALRIPPWHGASAPEHFYPGIPTRASQCAAVLIAASEYDYYACTSGWKFNDGWNQWSLDYDRPLGHPNGSAVRNEAGTWHRVFASGTEVWLQTKDETDSSWGSSCIRWADGHVTRSGKLCEKEEGGVRRED